MSFKWQNKRALRAENRRKALALVSYDPGREADEKIEREAEERVRKRPTRVPVVEMTRRGQLSPEQAEGADFYHWCWHASRSTVTSTLEPGRVGGGEFVPPQERALDGLLGLRLCEAAVSPEVLAHFVDPVVIGRLDATRTAERLRKETGREVAAAEVMKKLRGFLERLADAKREFLARVEPKGAPAYAR